MNDQQPTPASPAQNTRQAPGPRTILMLQGLATPFSHRLALALTARGHTVHRVNFCLADWFFGPRIGRAYRQHAFRGAFDTLPAFYRVLIQAQGIDSILMFGDCRPVHAVAIDVARELGCGIFVFEEGYTRPGWITLEADGTNYFSRLSQLGNALPALAADARASGWLPANEPVIGTDMFRRAWMDVAGHAANILGKVFFPRYRSHRPVSIWKEAGGWLRRAARRRRFKGANAATIAFYEQTDSRFFLAPLQLNTDYQIRIHSNYADMPAFIRDVLISFAAHAPKDTRLFFKNHPLDNGMVPYRALIRNIATRLGVLDRVDFASGGDLGILLGRTQGVVLVNSTVGYAALRAQKPVKAMGRALYNLPGLADQQPLDSFWHTPTAPAPETCQQFLDVVRTYTQIRGDFFSAHGIEVAIAGTVEAIEGLRPRLPLPARLTTTET